MKKSLYLFLLVLLALSSCSKQAPASPTPDSQTVAENSSTPATTETPAPTGTEVTGGSGSYTLMIPQTFVADTEKGEALDLSYSDETNKMAVFTVTEAKTGVQVSSMEEYVDIAMESFKGLTKNALQDTIKNPNGYTVLDKKFTGNFQGDDVIMYTRLVDTGTDYIQLIVATDPKTFDANASAMLGIIESFTTKK